jgi:hypothetical protein
MPAQVGGELSGFLGRDLSPREQLSPLTPNLPHHPKEDCIIHNFIYIYSHSNTTIDSMVLISQCFNEQMTSGQQQWQSQLKVKKAKEM